MEARKEVQLFWNFFWHGFDIKQVIDTLLFLFLLTHIGLYFNEKALE